MSWQQPERHKSKKERTGHGNRWLRSALTQVAWGAVHTKGTYLSALYHRLAARRGGKRAIIAVAHAILTIIYHILRNRSTYRDLGEKYFDDLNRESVLHRAVRRIEALGYKVSIDVTPPPETIREPVFSR